MAHATASILIRIEAGTFLVAGAITRGDLTVANCNPEQLGAVIAKLRETGVSVEILGSVLKIARISDPQVSPDGHLIAFTVQTVDMAENRKPTVIWIVPVRGGAPRQITNEGSMNERPRWSPDSKHIAFVSNRSSTRQIWLMDANGANARQITNLSTEADGVVFAADGKHLVFTSSVYPDCRDEACNSLRIEQDKDEKVPSKTNGTRYAT